MKPQSFVPGARVRRACAALSLGLGGLAWTGAAHADLFADNDARRAILELRTQVAQLQQAQQTQQSQQAQQLQQVRNSMLDLANQIDQLKSEVAQLRGQQDTTTQQVNSALSKMQASQTALSQRLAPLEPVQVQLNGKTVTVAPAEKAAFEQALGNFRNGQFATSTDQLRAFITQYPSSAYLNEARYWLGNSLYGQQRYRDAVQAFQDLIQGAPNAHRIPEAMLGLANCQVELREFKAARVTLQRLIKKYPDSEASTAARDRLAKLHG